MATPKKNQPLRIIMDSNAFFVPLQFKIDVFSELERLLGRNFELILISPVKRELERLVQEGSPKMSKDASFALTFSEKCLYVKVPEKKGVLTDDAIVSLAQAWKAPVFTNDKALKTKLRDISMPVIYVRAKSRLEINGLIS